MHVIGRAWLTRKRRAANMHDAMESDLAILEQKLATLIAHTRALRAANESLRRDLAAAQERNREMNVKVQQAGARLDALIARMPSE
jgi:chromosome segregation ATPase